MTLNHHPEEDMQRLEQDVRMPLQELETEAHNPAKVQRKLIVSHSTAHGVERGMDISPARLSFQRILRQVLNVGKFLCLVLVVPVAVSIALWVATTIMIVSIAYTTYAIFLDGDRSFR